MKIKSIFVALASASLLASCGGAKWQSYSYSRTLSSSEKNTLLFRVEEATLAKISKLEIKGSSFYKTGLRESRSEGSILTEFFTKGEYYKEETTKVNSENRGVVEKSERTKKESLALFDEEKHLYAAVSEDTLNGSYSYDQGAYPEGYAVSDQLSSIFGTLSSTNVQAVENNKGEQFFLLATETESNSQVEVEHGFKVEHTVNRTQYAAFLNKDLTLKSFTLYTSSEKNRDPDTNEFFKKDKLYSENKTEYSFTYKDRADGSSKLSGIRQLAKEGYYLSNMPHLEVYYYGEDGTEVNHEQFFEVDTKQVSFSKIHVVFHNELLTSIIDDKKVDTLKFKLIGETSSNAKADPIEYNVDLAIGEYIPGNSNSTYADGKIKMGKADTSLQIELDIEATAEGIAVSNVVGRAMLYYPY